MIDKRVISALFAIPLLLFFVFSGGIVFKLGVMAITLIAIYEYSNAYRETSHRVITYALLIGYIINVFIVFFDLKQLIIPSIYLLTLVSMATPIFNKKYNVLSAALTVIGYIYVVGFFSLLIYIRDNNSGFKLIWIVFIIAFLSDTFAYYAGKNFGKRKLCPDVSPKKTVEGSIGGILGSIIGIIIWGLINNDLGFQWYQLIIMAGFGSIISQIGDLSASLIKRFVGIKDYGNIMPGHGGILDRFDSILFTAPVVYYYIVFLLG